MILNQEQEMIRDAMRDFAQERLRPLPANGIASTPSRPKR